MCRRASRGPLFVTVHVTPFSGVESRDGASRPRAAITAVGVLAVAAEVFVIEAPACVCVCACVHVCVRDPRHACIVFPAVEGNDFRVQHSAKLFTLQMFEQRKETMHLRQAVNVMWHVPTVQSQVEVRSHDGPPQISVCTPHSFPSSHSPSSSSALLRFAPHAPQMTSVVWQCSQTSPTCHWKGRADAEKGWKTSCGALRTCVCPVAD